MTHQLNIFLLLFGALQGGLLSIWFLRNQKKKIANLYFALFLIVIGLQLTFKVVSKGWLMDNVYLGYILSYKFPYLVGPLLYLYIKGRKENVFRKTDLLHFIPFAISCLYAVASHYNYWLYNFQWHTYTRAGFQLISVFAYGYLAFRLGAQQQKTFIKLVVTAESVIIVTLAVMVVYYGRFPDVRFLFLGLTALIYWISYQAIAKPDFFLETEMASIVPMGLRKSPKYAHSSLKPEEASRIEETLLRLMNTEKLFQESSLTIDLLAARLKTSRHHLSQVLNEKLGKTYVDYVCELRLEEAKIRLGNPANLRFTIAAIALDSGFNSVSSFNEVFKKRYGTTPSKFRDQLLKKMSA
jgi:AraC-like DNA-binding protein